jgi:hypothetical protein
MKVKNAIRKVGAVAASTLMVGMTMGAAQSLGEFPGMFVDDDGTPTAQVVVGSQGAVSDVVGAVNVAAALGQATLQTEETTETVDVETSGSIGWSASDGETLDSSNDQLYFGNNIDDVRQTLTEDHLDALETVVFQDDEGNSQDVEHYLYVNQQAIGFGNPGDTGDQDPFLYVNNPAEQQDVDTGLYRLQANMEDGLELSDGSGSANDAVLGEDIELFGKSFTISEDSFSSGDAGDLILYGSSEEYDLETGESTTFEVNGEEHELEVRAVTDTDTVAYYIDGELQDRTEGSTFNVDGTDVRVANVIQTSSQNSEGLATFSIGSAEYRPSHGDPVEDAYGDDSDGTYVQFSRTMVQGNNHYSDDSVLDSIEIGVCAYDSDNSYASFDDGF